MAGSAPDMLKLTLGTSEKSQGMESYNTMIPSSILESNTGTLRRGSRNINEVLDSKGEVSPLTKNREISEIERSRTSGQRRAASAAARSGMLTSGQANASFRGVDAGADRARESATADWARLKDENIRKDLASIYLPYQSDYMDAWTQRKEGEAKARQLATANTAGIAKMGIGAMMGGGK